jgi:hypothetical protein
LSCHTCRVVLVSLFTTAVFLTSFGLYNGYKENTIRLKEFHDRMADTTTIETPTAGVTTEEIPKKEDVTVTMPPAATVNGDSTADIPKTYKAAVYDKPGSISTKVTELETPQPGPGEVLIKL